jgi:site-specific DNA recombinase
MRVAGYARVSSERQRKAESIKTQIDEITAFIEMHPDWEVAEIYTDEAQTGTIALEARPGGKLLLSDLKAGKFEQLVVFKRDRLSREGVDGFVLTIKPLVKKLGLKGIWSLHDRVKFYDGSHSDELMMTLESVMAESENIDRIVRVNAGLRRRRSEGKIGCGSVLYGYRNGDDGKLAIYESEAEIVRTIFDLRIQGYDSPSIADYLNERGINTPSHLSRSDHKPQKWSKDTVRRILRKRTYTGEFVDGKRANKKVDGVIRKVRNPESSLVRLSIPAIIDRETFASAQRARPRGNPGTDEKYYMLTGMIFCGECGETMCGKTVTRDGKFWRYYYCNGRWNHVEKSACHNAQVNAQVLEERIIDIVSEWLDEPSKAVEQIVENQEKKDADYQNQIERLKSERESLISSLAKIPERREKFLTALESGYFTKDEITAKIDVIRQDEATYQKALMRIDEQLAEISFFGNPEELVSFFDGYKEFISDLDTDRHPKYPNYWWKIEDVRAFRQVLEKFIKRITVYPGERKDRTFRIDGVIDQEYRISLDGVPVRSSPTDITEPSHTLRRRPMWILWFTWEILSTRRRPLPMPPILIA